MASKTTPRGEDVLEPLLPATSPRTSKRTSRSFDYNISPGILLFVFTTIQFLIYVDRGGLTASVKKLSEAFELTQAEAGVLGGAFMISYCLTAPCFAYAVNFIPPVRVFKLGLMVWALATAGTGFSISFPSLLLCRLMTGVGDASFIGISATMINSFAPPDQKSKWLTCFYLSNLGTPFGAALGGLVVDSRRIDDLLPESYKGQSWRTLFLAESILMMIMICFVACKVSGPRTILEIEPNAVQRDSDTIWTKARRLTSNPVYMCVILSMAAQTFTAGGLAYFSITYSQDVFYVSASKAGTVIGAMSLVVGISGFALGGSVVDYLKNNQTLSPIMSALTVSWSCALLLVPPGLSFAFVPYFEPACIVLGVCLGIYFTSIGPTNCAIMWSTPLSDRAFGQAFCVLMMHVFGDASAPIVIGALQDKFGWKWATFIGTLPLLIYATLLTCAFLLQRQKERTLSPRNSTLTCTLPTYLPGD